MSHPYKKYEETKLWKIIDSVLNDLESNQDLKLTTAREYVIGYLCKKLDLEELITEKAISRFEIRNNAPLSED